MARLTSYLMTGILALTGAACATDVASPTAELRQGTNDPAVQNPGNGGTVARTLVEIALAGSPAFPAAHGKAKFKIKDGQRELEIEVEDLNRMAGQTVSFFLGGVSVGSATVDMYGEAELELNTRLGHTVPATVAGQAVEARAADGTVIASGSF